MTQFSLAVVSKGFGTYAFVLLLVQPHHLYSGDRMNKGVWIVESVLTATVLMFAPASAQIPEKTKPLVLDADATAGHADTTIDHIYWAPADDNPPCMTAEVTIVGIPANTNVARCQRLCGTIPAGYTFDESRKIRGITNYDGYNSAFNPESFPGSKTACIYFKNWSDTWDIKGTLYVPLRKE